MEEAGRLARPDGVADGVDLVLLAVPLHAPELDPLVEILEAAGRVPAQLRVLLPLLDVPDDGALVLADAADLAAVGAEVDVVDLLVVGGEVVHLVQVGQREHAQVAVVAAAGQELPVETDPDHLAVRLRGAEIYLHLLQGLGFEHQLGLGLGALVPR